MQITPISELPALVATSQKALVNYFFFPLGPVQLKDSEVLKVGEVFHIRNEAENC